MSPCLYALYDKIRAAVTDLRRTLFRRVVVFQPSTHTILDLPARHVLSTPGPRGEEERVDVADGSTRPTRRRHTMEIPLTTDREAEVARLLARDIAGPVQCVLLGARGAESIAWMEPTRLNVTEPGSSALSFGRTVMRLETTIFRPLIGRGGNLLSFAPWRTATAEADAFTEYTIGGVAVTDTGDLITAAQDAGLVNIHDGLTSAIPQQLTANEGIVGAGFGSTQGETGVLTVEGSQAYDLLTLDGNTFGLQTSADTVGIAYDPSAGEVMRQFAGGDIFAGGSTLALGVNAPQGLAWDGSDLWYADGTELVQLDGKSTTELNRYDVGFPIADIGRARYDTAFDDGVLIAKLNSNEVYQSTGWNASTTKLLEASGARLGSRVQPGAPLWGGVEGTQVALDGIAPSYPTDITIPFPAWGARLKYTGAGDSTVTGGVRCVNASGNLIDSFNAEAPFTVPPRTWELQITLKDQTLQGQDASPQLRVLSAGAGNGAIIGSLSGAPDWETTDLELIGEDV